MTTTKEALEPCRFCGKESKGHWDGPYIHVSGAPGTLQFYSIVCNGCCSTASYETKERAIAKWNSRAAPIAPVDHEAKAKEIVEEYKQRVMQLPSGDAVPCAKWLETRLRIALDLAAPASTVAPQPSDDVSSLSEYVLGFCPEKGRGNAILSVEGELTLLGKHLVRGLATRLAFAAGKFSDPRHWQPVTDDVPASPAAIRDGTTCLWTLDPETDYWRSACGTTYFNEDDPATIHAGVLFCHHCGKRIEKAL